MVYVVLLAVPVENASTLEKSVAYYAGELNTCFVGFEMFHVIWFILDLSHTLTCD